MSERRERRTGIVLQFLLGIKQMDMTKIPLGKNQGGLQVSVTTIYLFIQHSLSVYSIPDPEKRRQVRLWSLPKALPVW